MIDNVEGDGEPAVGSPHVVTVRTPDARLVWYKEIAARSAKKIAERGVFDTRRGALVRDDYAGLHQFDATLAGSSSAQLTWFVTYRACSISTRRYSNGPARCRKPCGMRPVWSKPPTPILTGNA